MAHEPVVWIIDEEQWPRACLRAELIERGYDGVGFVNVAHALAAMGHPGMAKPCIIVLELRGLTQKRGELEGLIRYGVPIILLGGAVELNEGLVKEHEWAAVMRRPFTLGAVVDKVEKLLVVKKRTDKEA